MLQKGEVHRMSTASIKLLLLKKKKQVVEQCVWDAIT